LLRCPKSECAQKIFSSFKTAEGRLEGIEALYREGMLVKALDESGEPLLRKGQQVYIAIDGATSAERAFWNKENKVS
jgi:hypothetical protein